MTDIGAPHVGADGPSSPEATCAFAAQLAKSNKTADARALLIWGIAKWSGSFDLLAALAELSIGEGKMVEVAPLVRKLSHDFPDKWQPHFLQARIDLVVKDFTSAIAALDRAANAGGPRLPILNLKVRAAELGGDVRTLESALREASRSGKTDDQPRLALVKLLKRQKRIAEAVQIAEESLLTYPQSERLYNFLVKIAQEAKDPARVLDLCRRRSAVGKPVASWSLKSISAFVQSSQIENAKRRALEDRALWSANAGLIAAVSRLPWSKGEVTVVSNELRNIADRLDGNSGKLLSACILGLLMLGDDTHADQLLSAPPSSAALAESPLLRMLIAADKQMPPITMPSFNQAVTIVQRSGANGCLLVFSGINDNVQLPIPLFHRVVSTLDLHLVYFRDELRNLYLTGIEGVSPGLEKAADGIRRILSDIGAQQVYTLGNSSGGFGAIAYGIQLGAKGVIASGSPTNLRTDFMSADGRATAVINRLNSQLPAEVLDLGLMLRSARNRPEIYCYFGAEHALDAAHAKHIAGFGNVHLRPVADCESHGVILPLMERGELLPAIAELVGGKVNQANFQ